MIVLKHHIKLSSNNVPGEIEAENYNSGGQGVAYNDNDAVNNGGAYRLNEGVDIQVLFG